jgi:hypothetical protein
MGRKAAPGKSIVRLGGVRAACRIAAIAIALLLYVTSVREPTVSNGVRAFPQNKCGGPVDIFACVRACAQASSWLASRRMRDASQCRMLR